MPMAVLIRANLFESLQEHSFLHLTLCWSTFIGTLFCTINFASVYVLYCVLYYSRCLVLRFIGAPFCSITLSCSTFYWSTILFNHVVLHYFVSGHHYLWNNIYSSCFIIQIGTTSFSISTYPIRGGMTIFSCKLSFSAQRIPVTKWLSQNYRWQNGKVRLLYHLHL